MTVSLGSTSRQVVVATTPDGLPAASDFRVVEKPMPVTTAEQVLLRVETLSLDPYLRSLLGPGHLGEPAVRPGQLVPGRALASVLSSPTPDLAVGSLVLAETGWQEHAAVAIDALTPVSVPDGVASSAALGVLGMPGLTAWAAHVRHLRPGIGDTVVVGAATGAVGSLAGQLARLAGARAVGIVGSPDKMALARTLGFDAAVVRTEPDWIDSLHAACPGRVDAYLHLGDQATLDGVVEHLAIGARVSLCGVIDQSNGAEPTRVRAGALMAARASAHGMVVYDHSDLAADHQRQVGALLARGEIRLVEDRRHGLDAAPQAFSDLMAGRNHGKVILDLTGVPA